jgi:hypothetical protein
VSSAKKPATKPRDSGQRSRTRAAPDEQVAKVIDAFLADPRLAPIAAAFKETEASGSGRRSFGSNGLKVNGKLFALFTQGTLVVKLPKARVAALVEAGIGEPFDPGHGRLMKEWLTVRTPTASWIDLAREAHDFVRGGKG